MIHCSSSLCVLCPSEPGKETRAEETTGEEPPCTENPPIYKDKYPDFLYLHYDQIMIHDHVLTVSPSSSVAGLLESEEELRRDEGTGR